MFARKISGVILIQDDEFDLMLDVSKATGTEIVW